MPQSRESNRVAFRSSTRVLLASVTLATAVPAQPETPYRLSWQVRDEQGCSSPEQFAQRVERRLARAVFSENAPQELEVSISRLDEGGRQVRIRLLGEDGRELGRRELKSDAVQCSAVLSAAALTIELMLSGGEMAPEAVAGNPGEAQPEGTRDEAIRDEGSAGPLGDEYPNVAPDARLGLEAGRDRAPEPDDARAPSELPSRRFFLGAFGEGHLDTLPQVVPGAALQLEYRAWSDIVASIELGMTGAASEAQTIDEQPLNLRLSLWRLAGRVGWVALDHRDATFSLSAAAHIGLLSLQLEGGSRVGPRAPPWAALGATGAARLRIFDRLWLAGKADLLVPLLSDEFGVQDGPTIAALPPVGGFAGIGLGAEF